MLQKLSLFIYMCMVFTSSAQTFPGGNISVKIGAKTLQNPWAGGVDMPQFSVSDINSDGKKDLIIFDSKADKWLIFLNKGTDGFLYVPQYQELYPDIINLGLIRDYNCDGKGDIFAHTNAGIKVYKNTNENGNPSFELVNSKLRYQLNSGSNSIYKYNNDIVAIDDFDGDGDMDILSFDLLGTTIPYYRNLSVENGYNCDSLIYEENTVCWGHFKEGALNNDITLNFNCKGNEGDMLHIEQNVNRHAGSTLAVLDDDEDNDKDLLLGDVAYNNLVYLKNGGTNLNANMVSVETNFPANDVAVDVNIFPAAFYLDVNNDNLKDLLISPNAPASAVNKDCVWYYENSGNAADRFKLKQKNFLVETMLDYGSNSFATFFDHNADGLLDLIVANGFEYTEFGTTKGLLVYFENTGTAQNPAFTFVTDNYAAASNFNFEYMRPTFGDLDGDGDDDMILGEINGALHFFKNEAGAGNEANFVFAQANYFDIDIGTNSHPQLVDLNQDGLLDLVVGRKSPVGNVAYYRNIGTASQAIFHKDTVNAALGNIHVENPGFLFGYSAPFVAKPDAMGKEYIYVGSELGFIHKYEINRDSLESGSFVEVLPKILEVRNGRHSTLSIVDINNDGVNDYFVGGVRGGVSFYSDVLLDTTLVLSTERLHSVSNLDFTFYPNPATQNIVLNFNNFDKAPITIEIIDVLGKQYLEMTTAKVQEQLSIATLSKGMYMIKVSQSGRFITKKLIVN